MPEPASLARPELIEALRWTSATETAAKVRAGELTPRDAVAAALARIDAAEPVLNAFTYRRDAQALEEADAVSVRLAAGEYLPLAGVPIAVKDDVDFAGYVVTHGSRSYTQPATEDAEVIQRVRAAGAVVIGTTRTPEYCAVPFTESDLGGITRNPWDPSRTPGGSSGGSAAAVAAGLVPIALGGDGGGSLRGPAAWCGLVGLFPTPGSVSAAPATETWTGLGVQGGLARTVADTAALYDVLMTDSLQLSGAIGEAPSGLRIAATLDRATDRPLPLGGPLEPAWKQAFEATGQALRGAGHEVVPTKLRWGLTNQKFTVRYLYSIRQERLGTDAPERVEKTTKLATAMGRPAARALGWAVNSAPEQAAIERQLAGADLVLTPAMPVSAPPVGERDRWPALKTVLKANERVSYLNSWNHLGWPGVSVPAGVDDAGLPTSALLTARPGQERLLLQVAAQLEQARPWQLGKAVA